MSVSIVGQDLSPIRLLSLEPAAALRANEASIRHMQRKLAPAAPAESLRMLRAAVSVRKTALVCGEDGARVSASPASCLPHNVMLLGTGEKLT